MADLALRRDGQRYPAGMLSRSAARSPHFCWRKALRRRQPPIFIAHTACCRAQKLGAWPKAGKPAGNGLPPGAVMARLAMPVQPAASILLQRQSHQTKSASCRRSAMPPVFR
jgi:hypothetical protein